METEQTEKAKQAEETRQTKEIRLARPSKRTLAVSSSFIVLMLIVMPFIVGITYESAAAWVRNYYSVIYSSAIAIYAFLISLIKGTIIFIVIPIALFALVYMVSKSNEKD